ncbi:MAG: hypothetical protein Q3976_00500 [Corynebacterium sp.]|nr:hypothetical protein [Corynebacterium sp.]
MLQAVSFALIDSINLLLIGILVAIAVLIPAQGPYAKVASLLLIGDWFGVFLAALPTFWLFSAIQDSVQAVLGSSIFGIVLIVSGLLGVLLTWRSDGKNNVGARILGPLRMPGWKTVVTGTLLGAIQSLTSVPFYGGLAYLATTGLHYSLDIVALALYASLAISLPIASALGLGIVRQFPESPVGRGFLWLRLHTHFAGKLAAYGVGIVLVFIGVLHL